ncbi:hypothetical protein [Flavobacterium sp. 3HN19-14]|uniref:hypothetical protein n=1 Tax=Flavobacterium sp. 3HN19-14 TaxID=3448133 RepID=UPI003EE0617E
MTEKPLITTLPLLPDHSYDVYVRVNCSPSPSPWSTAGTFTTLPTCFKPTNPQVPLASITLTGATFSWTPGLPTDTIWEMLIIPGPNPPATLPENTTPPTYTNITTTTYTVNDLSQATIYYAYVRTYCSATDQSVWVPFTKFNTVTCDAADKCNYKFVLTDTGSNGWNNGRMQIRHNGIVIATIGASISGAGQLP